MVTNYNFMTGELASRKVQIPVKTVQAEKTPYQKLAEKNKHDFSRSSGIFKKSLEHMQSVSNLMRGVKLEKEPDEDHSYSSNSRSRRRRKQDRSAKTISGAQRLTTQQSKPRLRTFRDQTPSPSGVAQDPHASRRNTELAARIQAQTFRQPQSTAGSGLATFEPTTLQSQRLQQVAAHEWPGEQSTDSRESEEAPPG